MCAGRLSRIITLMHPTLMTIYANAQSEALRDAAEKRRRLARSGSRRAFTFRIPRLMTRVAGV
jgi:hypothetical protein